MDRKKVFKLVSKERNYQDLKHGQDPEWLLLIEDRLAKAKKEWIELKAGIWMRCLR